MVSQLETLLSKILKKTTPNHKERKQILELAEKLRKKVADTARKKGLNVEVSLEGSVAKDTWLRESPDIDVFICVPPNVPREAFGTTYLSIAKKATAGAKQIERFAEHPYLEAVLDGTRVNIVPCYRVRKGEWKSATDRTPFHTNYVKPLLNEKLCGEIRLLKRFMKGTDVYGAEIKVGGFSGYLCELLILFFGSFQQTLKEASDWKHPIFIDLENHYTGRGSELKLLFKEPLVIVDPVDKGRNAASAVRKEPLEEFVAASRAFLANPNAEFFYPQKTKPFNTDELSQVIRKRGTSLTFLRFGKVEAVPDVLWGQLYKSQRSLRTLAKQHGFEIVRDAVWSNEKSLNVFLLEAEHRCLPALRRHLGPPLEKKSSCDQFLKKHVGSKHVLSGPRIENGRWVVETKREYLDLVDLLRDKLREGGRKVGVAEYVSQAIMKNFEVLVNEQIVSTYSQHRDFAEFLTKYLRGNPRWLIAKQQTRRTVN